MRIDIEEAQGKLSELVGKVVFGGENQVIITKRGMPVAKLVDYYSKPQEVKLGVADGLFEVPDDFDTMMSDEIAEMFGVS